jgi:hypothetical protein
MRSNLLKPGVGLFLSLCLLLSSCKNYEDFDRIDGVDYNGEMAVPLTFGSISLQDILDDSDVENELSSLIINPDGSMVLVYESDQVSLNIAGTYDSIPDFPLVIPETSNEFELQLFEEFDVQELRLKRGSLRFQMQSPHQEDINVLITLPNFTKNGAVFNVQKTIHYNGSAPSEAFIDPINMAGYTLSLDNNMMTMYYQAQTANGNNVEIFPIVGMAENWEYDFIKGNWKADTIQISRDTMLIDLYENSIGGNITFADPRISIIVNNSFGFNTQVNITELQLITPDNESIWLESEVLSNGITLNYPSLTEVGNTKETAFTLNKNNSNLADLLNARPKQLIYDAAILINPENNNSLSGFMTDNSGLDFRFKTELPIYGTASGFTIEEPMELDWNDLDNIEAIEFKIIVDNGMPIEAGMQLYFLDEQDNRVDSLYSDYQYLIKAASVGNDGQVTAATQTVSFVTFDAARVERIKNSSRMLMGATFSTANEGNTPVRIMTTQEMAVKVGMKVRLKE